MNKKVSCDMCNGYYHSSYTDIAEYFLKKVSNIDDKKNELKRKRNICVNCMKINGHNPKKQKIKRAYLTKYEIKENKINDILNNPDIYDNYKLEFGKYSDKTYIYVFTHIPDYCDYVLSNNNPYLDKFQYYYMYIKAKLEQITREREQ
uniref:Uncharacterized protein n=1 Tax=Pithovirus LCPAC102 TaxID=2506587 RepID=A0A481Z4X5_9VIRU|nr:MAG: hypothetical protein LCPAC102_00180 [Pithovirus LCPAC102]